MEDPRFRDTRQRRDAPPPDEDGIRLEKALALQGLTSRRDVERLVREGRIRVNGKAVRELPCMVRPGKDLIEVDGEEIDATKGPSERAAPLYIALNKPKNIISTADDPDGRTTVVDLVSRWVPRGQRVYPVGRLDADSTGLILLTNDGDLAHRLTHPRFGISKEYLVMTQGALDAESLAVLKKGLFLASPGSIARSHAASAEGEGEPRRRVPAATGATNHGRRATLEDVRIVRRKADRSRGDLSQLSVTLQEGQNREIRRLLARVGVKVKRLERVAIGPLKLGTLKIGMSRLLTEAEVAALRAAAGFDRRAVSAPAARAPRPRTRG